MRKLALVVSLVMAFSALSIQPASAVPPTIDSFDPTSGPVGTPVQINGSGFAEAFAVEFNGTNATFTLVSDTEIDAVVPAGATTGPITVEDTEGTATSASNFTVAPPPTPEITDFSPRRGPVGTRVRVEGERFIDVVQVRLRGRAVDFTVLSPTALRFRVPRGAKSGRIAVETETGTDTTNQAFVVRKDRSVIEFKLSGHLTATGKVRATDGERVCRVQRRVTVQERAGGSWRSVRSTRTQADGGYRVELPDATGTYRAAVSKKSTATDLCSGDASKTKRHRHPGGGGGGGGGGRCDPAYPTVCIPSPPPDLDCGQIQFTNFLVKPPDPHNFDSDGDGRGCEG